MENNIMHDKMSNILKNGVTLSNGLQCRVMNPTLITRYIHSIEILDVLSNNLGFDNSVRFADEKYLIRLICDQFADNIVLAYNKGDRELLDKTNNNIRFETGRLREVKKELINVINKDRYLYNYTYDDALELLSSYFTAKEIDKMCLIPITSSRSVRVVSSAPIYNKKGPKNNKE